jgi:hypothetical protein
MFLSLSSIITNPLDFRLYLATFFVDLFLISSNLELQSSSLRFKA